MMNKEIARFIINVLLAFTLLLILMEGYENGYF